MPTFTALTTLTGKEPAEALGEALEPVSYTHLTLPTNREV